MAIHYAKIKESDRLRRVHSLLADGQWHGTRDIMFTADVCAVNTVIAELRANGFRIETRCVGRGRYEYQMAVARRPKVGSLNRGCASGH